MLAVQMIKKQPFLEPTLYTSCSLGVAKVAFSDVFKILHKSQDIKQYTETKGENEDVCKVISVSFILSFKKKCCNIVSNALKCAWLHQLTYSA